MPSSPGTPGKADKGMSSRLLTMKVCHFLLFPFTSKYTELKSLRLQFMQRAAASAASKESDSASSGPISKEKAHNSKRLRPSTDNSAQNELDTIAAALAAEEEKRREVIARQAAEAGESQWVLNIPAAAPRAQPYVMAADSLDADDDNNGGRRGFGNFKRKQTIVSFFQYILINL